MPIRTRKLFRTLRSETGAIDLASIMVGVIVTGLVASTAAASVGAVIPWAQDNATAENLHAVATAESVARAKEGAFLDLDGLQAKKYLPPAPNTAIGLGDDCFVAVAESDTGELWVATSADRTIQKASTADTSWCTDLGELIGELRPTAPTIMTVALPEAEVGEAYAATVVAAGARATFRVSDGALPAGLTLDTRSGEITGTPTEYRNASFELTATGKGGDSAPRDYELNLAAAPEFPAQDMVLVSAGESFSTQLKFAGKPAPTVRLGSGYGPPPAWVSLTADGVLRGTAPVDPGPRFFEVVAESATGTAKTGLLINVVTTPTITTDGNMGTFKVGSTIDGFKIGMSGTGRLQLHDGSELPPGISAAYGPDGITLDGTLANAGSYQFTVEVAGYPDVSRTFAVTVWEDIHVANLPEAKLGEPYDAKVVATAIPFSVDIRCLPETKGGLTIDARGNIAGISNLTASSGQDTGATSFNCTFTTPKSSIVAQVSLTQRR